MIMHDMLGQPVEFGDRVVWVSPSGSSYYFRTGNFKGLSKSGNPQVYANSSYGKGRVITLMGKHSFIVIHQLKQERHCETT